MNLYVVRNQEGRYFRAVGYGHSGDTWVDDLAKAKFYAKIGQAKSRITYFAREWSDYGTPVILEFTLDVAAARVMDMTEYAKGTVNRIARRKLEDERQYARQKLESLQREETRISQEILALKDKIL